MAMMSSGECQCAHWVRDVTDRPCTVGGEDGLGSDDMLLGVVCELAVSTLKMCDAVGLTSASEVRSTSLLQAG